MKINMTKEECEKRSLLGFIVIEALVGAIGTDKKFEEFMKDKKVGKDYIYDVHLTANGVELDLQKAVDHWGSQVERMIGEKAKELLEDKFRDITYAFDDLKSWLDSEINKHLEDWEKENKEGK
jgi:hypothetical protein